MVPEEFMGHILHDVGLRRSTFSHSINIALWAVDRFVLDFSLNNTVHTVNFHMPFFLDFLDYLDVFIKGNL